MNTKTMHTTTCSQLTKKNNFITHLFIGYMKIFNPVQFIFQFIQLVVMGSKQGFGLCIAVMQMLHNTPGNTNTIVSRSATANFIQQYQTSGSNIIDNTRCFIHFHHKGTFATTQVIACAYPCKYLIRQWNFCIACRYKTTNMSHQRN